MITLRRCLKLIISFFFGILFFLPQSSYAESLSDGFDYPLGKPSGQGYGVQCCGGLGFLERHDYSGDGVPEFHPGEDWNDDNSGNDFGTDREDKNDPVFNISNGKVIYARYSGKSWGYLVLIEHTLTNGSKVWSQYAHLSSISIQENVFVPRGVEIGKVGDYFNGTGKAYHLHFEIRKVYRAANEFVMNWSKEKVIENYYNPSQFIDSHRPVVGQVLTANSDGPNKISLSWTKSESPEFDKYEVYKSEVSGGTEDPVKRSLLYTSPNKEIITAFDTAASGGKTYYYRIFTYYKNGMVGKSEEVSVEQKMEVIKITNNEYQQSRPVIDGKMIFWVDSRLDEYRRPAYKLFYYNLETKEEGSVDTQIMGIKCPEEVAVGGGKVVITGTNSGALFQGRNIYYINLEKGLTPVTNELKDQDTPAISEEGIVVWSDMQNGTDRDIYYLDTKNALAVPVPFVTGAGNQRHPKIWGNKVVWKDSRVGNRHDLYIKEIGGAEELLATNVGDSPPSIWGDWVTWEYKGNITLLNLLTKERKTISELNGWNPKVKDGKVVYTGSEGTISYIHVYDISTATEQKINFVLNYQAYPSISGNVVVFEHSEKLAVPNMDIYLVYL